MGGKCDQQEEATMARGGAWAAAAAAVLWWMAAGARAVWLEIAPSGTKCVAEEIRSNVVVIGDYSVLYEHQQAHPTVSVKVIHLRTFTFHTPPERSVHKCNVGGYKMEGFNVQHCEMNDEGWVSRG